VTKWFGSFAPSSTPRANPKCQANKIKATKKKANVTTSMLFTADAQLIFWFFGAAKEIYDCILSQFRNSP